MMFGPRNLFAILEPLLDAPSWSVWLAKLTCVLAVAWLAHAMLRAVHPGWRVLLWRGALVVVLVVTSMAPAPAVFKVELATRTHSAMDPYPIRMPDAVVRDNTSQPRPIDQAPASSPIIQESAALAGNNVAPVPTANAPESMDSTSITAGDAIFTIWACGMLVFLLRLACGWLIVIRSVRRSVTLTPKLRERCVRIAEQLGASEKLTVRRSDRATSPCAVGLFRPVLLLPASMDDETQQRELEAIMAHEWSHVRSGDLIWNTAFQLAAALLWLHPLVWRIRSSHAFACELSADARSADFVGGHRRYRSILARIAVRAQGAPPSVGLPMARRAQIHRRLEILNRETGGLQFPRHRVAALAVLATTCAVALGGLHFVRAQAPQPKAEAPQTKTESAAENPEPKNAKRSMAVRILDQSGKTVPGAYLSVRIGGEYTDYKLDERGAVQVPLPPKDPGLFVIKAKAPDHVWMRATWRPRSRKEPLPDSFTFKMEPGTKIGGIVVDEEGKPVAGVKVSFSAGGPETRDRAEQSIYAHIETTDADGRWVCKIIPSKLENLAMTFVHADYVSDHNSRGIHIGFFPQLREMSYRRVMETGVPVQGQVVDPEGKPIEGAVLAMGRDPTGAFNPHPKPKTNKDGRYRFVNQRPGPSSITVIAKGFSPETRNIVIRPNISPLDIQLKPGHTIRMRVLDRKGNPLSGVVILPVAWRGTEALKGLYNFGIPHTTDDNGRFVWNWAPRDAVDYDIFARGVMSIRDRTMVPREDEYVLRLDKELDISGSVVDAKTGKPIELFQLIPGIEYDSGISWQRSWRKFGKQGRYEYRRTIPAQGYHLRIEAGGYKPAISRVFRSNEEKVTYNFKLQRGEGPSGVVLSPAGKPLAGADVILCTPQAGPTFHYGAGYDRDDLTTFETGADGRFRFPFQAGPFVVAVVSKQGFARTTQAELEREGSIRVKPWARVAGVLMIGAKLGANQSVVLRFPRAMRKGDPRISFYYDTKTDQDGKFAFDRVPPGMEGHVARQIRLGGGSRMVTHRMSFATRAGREERVLIGGTGRPVIGKLVSKVDVKRWDFSIATVRRAGFGLPPASSHDYSFKIQADGSFRVEDVAPGSYVLTIQAYRPVLRQQRWTHGPRIGAATCAFEIKDIPEGRSDKPLNLGNLKLE